MVRHVYRHVVKHDGWEEFKAVIAANQAACLRMGLPAYRLYATVNGVHHEVFEEAEFESVEDMGRRWAAASEDPEIRDLDASIFRLSVDGQSHDYFLEEVALQPA
jgi:hypothetical protein